MIQASSSDVLPVSRSDRKLSQKHLKDSIHYNEKHAEEHEKQEKIAKAKLKALEKKMK